MKESIHIKNFGPIKDIYIEEIKPFMVLIGKSGSGKSTLMKTISLFRWIYKMLNIRSYLKHSNISKSPFKFTMESYLINCGFEQFVTADTEIIYKTTFASGNSYEIVFTKNGLSKKINTELIKQEDLYFTKVSFISETRNIIPLWNNNSEYIRGGANLWFYFHEVNNDFNLATAAIKELEIPFLDLKFTSKKTSKEKKYILQSTTQDNFEIDYKNSSSGTQTVVPLLLIAEYFSKNFSFENAFDRSVLKYLLNSDRLTDFKAIKNLNDLNKKIFIHIEEPELSLYPDAQCDLMSHLINKCFIANDSNNDIEITLSTHSPYILNYLNLLIKANEKDTLINGAKIDFDKLLVYQIVDGKNESLMALNEKLINTNLLSDTINDIYDAYNKLG